MFTPPRCPNPGCPFHKKPIAKFFVRKGFYHPLCRKHPVPRFKCRCCELGFSRQTFRADYCDNKPDRNVLIFRLLNSGIGLRQTHRLVGLTRRLSLIHI